MQFEEVVIWGRNREFVTGEALLEELRRKGFEPQVVGEIDPPPRNGGSWVLKDKRDRARREDDGVWISWTRPRGGEARNQYPTRYVIETFDGRSGYDWFLSCALAASIARTSRGQVSVDGGPDKDGEVFASELAKDPSTNFVGPESAVDWESQNLDTDVEEDDDDDDDDDEESVDEEAEGEGAGAKAGEDDDDDDEDDEDYESGDDDDDEDDE